MPLSVQGNEALTEMFDLFRASYVEKNPGCNENDVERVFLHHLLGALVEHSDAFAVYSKELREVEILIEDIQ
jgi:hypothetical protein